MTLDEKIDTVNFIEWLFTNKRKFAMARTLILCIMGYTVHEIHAMTSMSEDFIYWQLKNSLPHEFKKFTCLFELKKSS